MALGAWALWLLIVLVGTGGCVSKKKFQNEMIKAYFVGYMKAERDCKTSMEKQLEFIFGEREKHEGNH